MVGLCPDVAPETTTGKTTTSEPSGPTPEASQPRIIGSLSSDRPTPRSDHRSWWLSELALISTRTQSSGTDGSGRSPTSRPASGSSGLIRAAYAARIPGTLAAIRRLGSGPDHPTAPHPEINSAPYRNTPGVFPQTP